MNAYHVRLALCALWVMATATGCFCANLFQDDLYVFGTAHVEGPIVTITVSGVPKGGKITVDGVKKTSKEEWGDVRFDFPLSRFKAGPRTLKIKASHDGAKATEEVSFTVPKDAPKVFAHVSSCKIQTTDQQFAIEGDFGSVYSCQADKKGRMHMEIVASPGSKVTIGGKSKTLKKGQMSFVHKLDTSDLMAKAPLSALISNEASLTNVKVKVVGPKRKKGKKRRTVKGVLKVKAPFSNNLPKRLSVVESGKRVDGVSKKTDNRTMAFVDGNSVELVGTDAPLSKLDLVAVIAQKGKRREGPSCGPYTDSANNVEMGSVSRYFIDKEVVVYNAGTGGEVTRKVFEGGGGGCPMFVTTINGVAQSIEDGPSSEDIKAWLGGQVTP